MLRGDLQQLPPMDRLRQIVVEAGLEDPVTGFLQGVGGESNDGAVVAHLSQPRRC